MTRKSSAPNHRPEPSQPVAAAPEGSRSLTERAYEQLRDDIIEGRLGPGEKLRVEHLKLRYQVGAGTLREALTRLVSDALVVTEAQRGFFVAPMTIEDLADLTELRVQIEINALRQSVREGSAQWRSQLRLAYERLCAVEEPPQVQHSREWEHLNTQFHETLISGHESAWTQKLLRILAQHGERYRRHSMSLSQSGRDLHQEHREIFEAAMAGNELRAALALEAHIRATPDLLRAAAQGGAGVFQAFS
jgi:DNA-binding GntR family transcriptional regulator